MSDKPKQALQVVSWHLGRRIRLEDAARALVDRVLAKTKSDICLRLGDGWIYLFAFGSVVFIGVDKTQVDVFLGEIETFVEGRSERLTDDFRMVVDATAKEKVYFDHISLAEANQPKMRILCLVLAQSTTLEHFEKLVEDLLDKAASFTDGMASGGRWTGSVKEMTKFIGVGLATRRQIVSNLSILDSPDIVWEDSTLDSLFHELKSNFELSGRYRTLEHKLRLIHESVEVLVDLSNTRQAKVMEITVIVLIFVEVLLAFLGHR